MNKKKSVNEEIKTELVKGIITQFRKIERFQISRGKTFDVATAAAAAESGRC